MNDIAAALGIEQLKKLDFIVDKKIKIAQFYTKSFSDLDWLITPKVQANSKHSFHKYTIRIVGKSREEVIKKLSESGIGNAIFYNKPIHKQKLYLDLGYKDKLPVVEAIIGQVLSLPVHPGLNNEELEYISEVMHNI
jgi:dTDP-4-amino-4,6-dideoxygalactose transaminase